MIQENQILAKPLQLDVSALQLPTQIFHGQCDQINPVGGARALVQQLPNAQLQELPDMGHAFIYAEWDWLLEAAIGRPTKLPTGKRRGILKRA